MPAATFKAAPDVEDVARLLIADYHKHLLTHNVRIDFLFRDKPEKVHGKDEWITAKKIVNLAAFLAGDPGDDDETHGTPFFVVCVYEKMWQALPERKRKAGVDHALCHLGAEYDHKGRTRIEILPHDLEAFQAEYNRHGAWRKDIKRFLTSGQMGLDFVGDETEDEEDEMPAPGGAEESSSAPSLTLTTDDRPSESDRFAVAARQGTVAAAMAALGAGQDEPKEEDEDLWDGVAGGGELPEDQVGEETPPSVTAFLDRQKAAEAGATEDDVPMVRDAKQRRAKGSKDSEVSG